MDRAVGPSGTSEWNRISLLLTDSKGIQPLNLQYLGHPEVTDVLSFRYEAIPGEEDGHSGELILNVELAEQEGLRRQASCEHVWGPSLELALYLAHGCDHLNGSDDGEAAGRKRMRRRELNWLKDVSVRALVDRLIVP